MHIISKYKDYYDYLTGIWGVDPKLILDRRKYVLPPYEPSNKSKITFYIAGKVIEGFYVDGKVYYGESLNQFKNEKITFSPLINERRGKDIYIDSKNLRFGGDWFSLTPYEDINKYNDIENCPILMKSFSFGEKYYTYPILNDWNIASIIPPEEMFTMISNWLSNKNTEAENRVDNRTDVEKLLSKGFDKKCSFRPKSKICE